mgnify:FL=1
MSIAYVEHPVNKLEKAKYLKSYDSILDVRFAPSKLGGGDKIFLKEKPEPKKKAK